MIHGVLELFKLFIQMARKSNYLKGLF